MTSNRDNSSGSGTSSRCKNTHIQGQLKAYVDRELHPVRSRFVDFHLSRCVSCKDEVDQLIQLAMNLTPLNVGHPRPELRARILATLPAMSPVAQRNVYTRPAIANNRTYRTAIATAFCLLLAFGAFAALNGIFAPHPVAGTPGPISDSTRPKPISTAVIPHASTARESALPEDLMRPDPTSLIADALAAKQLEDEKRAERLRIPQTWDSMIASAFSPSTISKPNSRSLINVVVEVHGLDAACSGLRNWAQHNGVSAELTADGNNQKQVILKAPQKACRQLFIALNRAGSVTAIESAQGEQVPWSGYQPGTPSDRNRQSNLPGRSDDAQQKVPSKGGMVLPTAAPSKVEIVVNLRTAGN